jgi:hypothetical protein
MGRETKIGYDESLPGELVLIAVFTPRYSRTMMCVSRRRASWRLRRNSG